MKRTYLEFERPIESLETKINSLQTTHNDHPSLDITQELRQLEEKLESLQHDIYDNLSAWEISQVSRHPQRPYTLDYINSIFTDFNELHGDRMFGDDAALICGIAKIDEHNFMFIGHQKGRDAKEKVKTKFWNAKARRL